MNLRIIQNEEKYFDFIRILRTHKENTKGFFEQVEISSEQQYKYMEKHKNDYLICIDENETPVGWIGIVENDIRFCVDPLFKNNGIGKFMLLELIKIHPNGEAKVLLENQASNKLCQSIGFFAYKKDEKFIYYRLLKE